MVPPSATPRSPSAPPVHETHLLGLLCWKLVGVGVMKISCLPAVISIVGEDEDEYKTINNMFSLNYRAAYCSEHVRLKRIYSFQTG